MADTPAPSLEPPKTPLWIAYMRLDEIRRDPGNSKEHDLGAIGESIRRFGFIAPMGLNEETGLLLFGHGRLDELEAAYARDQSAPEGILVDPADGMWRAPVVRGTHLNEKDGKAFLIAENRIVELGGWNEPLLVQRLIEIAGDLPEEGLRGTGFDTEDLDGLARALGPGEPPVGPGMNKPTNANRVWCPACGASFLLPQRAKPTG